MSRHVSLLLILLSFQTAYSQQHRFSCPAYGGGYIPVIWYPQYSAYIPADHISGPTSCFHWLHGSIGKIFKGDGNADVGNDYPIQSARTYSTYNFFGSFNNGVWSSAAYASALFKDTNQTRSYGHFSPANGAALSALDEDGVPDDCLYWHQWGFADKSNMHGELNITGPTGESGNARFYGEAANPLESPLARISWDMKIYMDGSNPTNARVTTINFNHSCFPAHNIKTQHTTVYNWSPPRADTAYVAGCLVFQLGRIVGEMYPNRHVPCD
jgi:hypothetical protein